MRSHIEDHFERWKLDDLLLAYPDLSLRPIVNGVMRLTGTLAFSADAKGLERIDDAYEVEIIVPPSFPRELPLVKETAGRIPKDFHTNDDGRLCLGSPVRQHLELKKSPTLSGFMEHCVIPYLYGFSFREKHGQLPFGELEHGMKGIRQDFAEVFGVRHYQAAVRMVQLAGMKKSDANKRPCPCGGGRRLGKCHNHRVNVLRKQLGGTWFREQYRWLTGK
jgi:hypothetical protein